jgi:nitrogen fixation NifU-like protein
VKELNLPPVKIHCSVLAEDAIKAAITDWRSRKGATAAGEANAEERKAAHGKSS